MTPTSLLEEKNRSIESNDQMKFKEEGRSFSCRNAVRTDSEINLFNQREQSMALNSEGLECKYGCDLMGNRDLSLDGLVGNIYKHLPYFQALSVPEVLRPLYESPNIIAQKMTIAVSIAISVKVVRKHMVLTGNQLFYALSARD
ncbi:unnamed protein product [Fraxinus pennsylvanica]|uniref:Uncharacterized protein n=1 Tax=Fraxinus pennsylvanica TaxID=56036 RepID=A0AAD2AAI7_9LAMI|nr:unnamed protein product [Fraxinus pennsylvanica]